MKRRSKAMNNSDVCQTLTLMEGLKKQVDRAQVNELYRKICMMAYLQPEIHALMIMHGKKNIENLSKRLSD